MAKDGQTPVTNNLNIGGNRITNVADGIDLTDVANIKQIQNSAFNWCGTAGGTANALTLSPAPAIEAYAAGQWFTFKAGANSNTDAVTVSVSGLATKAIETADTALVAGQISANLWYRITYDGEAFQLEQLALGGTGSETFTSINVTDTATVNDLHILGDVTFGDDATIDLPDGSVHVEHLGDDVLNLILSNSGGGSGGAGAIASGNGRLTLASDTPVMTEDVTGATDIFYAGSVILLLNDGTGAFNPQAIVELKHSLTDDTRAPTAAAAAKNYDLFGWGGDSQSVTSITRSGGTATVTKANHGYAVDEVVFIAGADQPKYNGAHKIVSTPDANTFTFAVTGTPASPATGTITMRGIFLSRGYAWDSDTSRGTGAGTSEIELVGSTYVNKFTITNGPAAQMGTYLGSIMTNAGAAEVDWRLGTAASGGGRAWLGVWNVSNRAETGTAVQDTDATWTKTTDTMEALNTSNTWRATILCGLNDSVVKAVILSQVFPPSTGSSAGVAVGLDSTSAAAARANAVSAANGNATTAANFPITSEWNGFIGLGKHFIQALQFADLASGTATLYGTNNSIAQSTMYTYSQQ